MATAGEGREMGGRSADLELPRHGTDTRTSYRRLIDRRIERDRRNDVHHRDNLPPSRTSKVTIKKLPDDKPKETRTVSQAARETGRARSKRAIKPEMPATTGVPRVRRMTDEQIAKIPRDSMFERALRLSALRTAEVDAGTDGTITLSWRGQIR